MSVRVCSRCGAPLPSSAVRYQRCEFCGVENDLELPQAPPPPQFVAPPPYVPLPPPQSSGAAVAIVLGVSGVLLAMGIGVAVWAASTPPHPAPAWTTTTYTPPIPTGPSEPPPVPLAALHTTPLTWTSSVKVDAPGRVGPASAFDPLANWEWAQTIGTSWWPDAKLYELAADPIAKDGTVDLTGPESSGIGPHVEYHFVSQDCKAAEKKKAETESNFRESSCSLEIEVKAKTVEVDLDLIGVDGDGRSKPIPKPPCSIADAFTYFDSKKLTVRPTYQIRLEYDVFGYLYRVSNGIGSASFDAMDVGATFCTKNTAAPKATTTAAASGTTAATTPKPASTAPVDRAALYSALKGAGIDSCKTQNGLTGPMRVNVVFQGDGSVRSATVTDQNRDTPAAACAIQKLKAIHVPPFNSDSVSVSAAL